MGEEIFKKMNEQGQTDGVMHPYPSDGLKI